MTQAAILLASVVQEFTPRVLATRDMVIDYLGTPGTGATFATAGANDSTTTMAREHPCYQYRCGRLRHEYRYHRRLWPDIPGVDQSAEY